MPPKGHIHTIDICMNICLKKKKSVICECIFHVICLKIISLGQWLRVLVYIISSADDWQESYMQSQCKYVNLNKDNFCLLEGKDTIATTC